MTEPLNLFYSEPDPDRWLPFDRYPRRLVRRLVRGPARPGGQARVFINLCAGLDRLGVPYRVNAFRHARANPEELACIVGKPFLLDSVPWRNPILFGAAMFSHPVDDPHLFERLPVRRLLVPGEWCRRMFAQHYGDRVAAWPVGIDTDGWAPAPRAEKDVDVLVYDKIRWERAESTPSLLELVLATLRARGLRVAVLRYGSYREEEFRALLRRSRAMVFLSKHETQGIAYQQALSCGVPILAWDPGGFWQDPEYFPERVRFDGVSSVPYWDERCGIRFENAAGFGDALTAFDDASRSGALDPRSFVVENLTLERCAEAYLAHVDAVRAAPRQSDGGAAPEFAPRRATPPVPPPSRARWTPGLTPRRSDQP